MVICLEQGADLHMAQLMPLPLTVSCFSKIQIGFTFLLPAHPDSPGQRSVKRLCVCWYLKVEWPGIKPMTTESQGQLPNHHNTIILITTELYLLRHFHLYQRPSKRQGK